MRIVLSLSLALAACSGSDPVESPFNAQAKAEEQAAKERAVDQRAVKAGFAPEAPAPVQTARLDPPKTNTPGSILPASDRQYRYLGRWAPKPALCATGAWRFESRTLTTAGETKCDFSTVANVPTGYRLNGTCQAEGKKTEQTVKLTFDETLRTMRVVGQTVGPTDLIYCGD